MSKNTGTSELINYFDLGVNGDVGISGSLTLDTIANAVIDTDKFLVSDNGIIKYRTGAELLSDIGVAGSFVTIDTAQTITGIKTFSGTSLQLESSGSADATILRNTSGVTGSTSNSNTIGFNGVNNIFVSTQNRGGFILGFNNSVQNREYTLPDASGTIALTSSIPANPVGGTGTTNYLPKFTGSTTIGNSNLINDTSGNLGLGVTPSAWNAVFKVLESGDANNQTAIAFQNNANVIYLTANSYFDTSWKYKFSDNAGQYLIDGNEHRWFNAPSGTAGNAISFTQAMTLTSGGNLLVGTTSDNGARLQVSGTATFSGNVGIGQSNPLKPLHIKASGAEAAIILERSTATTGGTYGQIGFSSVNGIVTGIHSISDGDSNGGHLIFNTTTTTPQNDVFSLEERMRITSGGNVLIGTTTEAAGVRLRVEGGVIRSLSTYDNTVATAANLVVSAGGTFERSTSSLKYKKEVRNYDKGLEVLKNMRPVYYKGKSQSDGNKQFAGLIAEEIHELGLNEFVQYANDGTPDALAYTHMVAILINSIKELKQEIDTLKN